MYALAGFRDVEEHPSLGLVAYSERSGRPHRLRLVDVRATELTEGLPLWAAQAEVQISARLGEAALSAELAPATSGDLLLAVEEPEGRWLSHELVRRRPLAESIAAAVALARAVGEVHRAGLVHGGLRPEAVFLTGEGRAKLTSFWTAFRPGSDVTRPPLSTQLHYVAPELTARVSRPADERADLYALGALFMHLFSGTPLFAATDALDLIHCHFAKSPVRLDARVPEVPEVLALIVDKLVAKSPEARYQTAAGLLADLEPVARGAHATFALGAKDASGRLAVPSKLFGREEELAKLRSKLESVRAGRSALLCVSGYSGVGKSALVRELSPAILAARGLFGEGKFDAYGEGVPASAFVEAFRRIALTFLGASEAELATLRAKLTERLGTAASVVADAIPAFELVLGKQPPLPPLGAQEAQNRFALAFDRLVTALTDDGRPLVLFIDDLQWADPLSLKLLTTLAGDPSRPFLLVGAYRDNEVTSSHPVSLAFAALEKAGTERTTLQLAPLSQSHVHALVAETVRRPLAECRALADTLTARTNGNPFFLGQILRTLVEEEAIWFDRDHLHFDWSLDAIARADITENVVEFLSQRIAELPEETRRRAGLMALLGTSFSADRLGVAMGLSPEAAAEAAMCVEDGGLIVASGQGASATWRFLHDRLREAALAVIPEAELRRLHVEVGLRLADAGADPFDVAHHLNHAADTQSELSARLFDVNRRAAERAVELAAHDATLSYLRIAVRHLPADFWERDPDGAYAMLLSYAEALGLAGLADAASGVFADLRARLDDPRRRARIAERESEVLHWLGQTSRAYDVVVEGLHSLGIELPTDPDEVQARAGELTGKLLRPESLAGLRVAPLAAPEEELVGRLYDRLIIASYFSCPQNLGIVIASNVDRVLERGLTAQSGEALAWFATLLSMGQNLAASTEYAELALSTVDRFDDPYFKGRALVLANCMSLGYSVPFEVGEQRFVDIFLLAHSSGDFQYASYALLCRYLCTLAQGAALGEIEQGAKRWADYCERYIPLELGQARIRAECARVLSGAASALDMDAVVGRYREDKNLTDVCESLAEMASLHLLLEDEERGLAYADEAAPILLAGAAGALLINPLFGFTYTALAGRVAQSKPKEERAAVLAKVAAFRERLAGWAAFCPANFQASRDLAEGEIALAEGRVDEAMALFLSGTEEARSRGYLMLSAYGARRLAERWMHRDRRVASVFADDARTAYARAGAAAVVDLIERRYGTLTRVRVADASVSSSDPTASLASDELDIETMIRASQAVSGEIVVSRLVDRLVRISVESAGASRGVIFVPRDGAYVVGASAGIEIAQGTPLTEAPGVARSVVQYALRTREPVVLGDTTLPSPFHSDPAFAHRRPFSVLCQPVVAKGAVAGVLYLENELLTGAFTRDRTRLLDVVASQAAISLENASLYATLEQRVSERTLQLKESLELVVQGREHLRRELSEAAAYVRSLLPPPSTYAGVRLDWRFVPSAELGGDAFTCQAIDDHTMTVLLFDVCGHGMASAMLSISVLSALSGGRLPGVDLRDPASILAGLNRAFPMDRHGGLFFTAWCGTFDARTRKLAFSSAGHPPGLLIGPEGAPRELEAPGPLVGLDPSAPFEAVQIEVPPKHDLFLFTDGLYEIERRDGTMVGYDRLALEIERHAAAPLDRIVSFALEERGRDGLEDDFSILRLSL